ncbi:MAG: 50S ribosomal protein L11 methyltransferase [Cyanobacteria bacterium P01_G01_bin.54]
MYSLAGHGKMLGDRPRMAAYAQALEAAIAPGMTVLDIGTGTGIHALLAARLGAAHVWAIEPDPIIHLAQRLAQENGYGDRISFIQNRSTHVDVPEPVNLIVSDLRGVLPLFQQHLPSLIDARTRLLKPDGILIPERDRLWVTLVHAPDLYAQHSQPWSDAPLGFDFRTVHPYAINRWYKCALPPESCVVPAQVWAVLDYARIESPDVQQTVTWALSESQTLHGLGMWFDATLYGDVCLSNAPEQPQLLYGQGFFPFEQPLTVQAGDRLTLRLQAKLVQNAYIWQWNSALEREGKTVVRYRQSTFAGQLRNPLATS